MVMVVLAAAFFEKLHITGEATAGRAPRSAAPSVPSAPGHLGAHAGRLAAARPLVLTQHGARGVTAPAPPLGVYTGPCDVGDAEAAAQQLGGRIPYALDFLQRTSWAALTSPTWLAQCWRGSPFHMVIGVPMLPTGGGTLAQGAAGAFDAEFALLARRLVADGLANAILMVGYQPDDSNTPWYVGSAVAAEEYVRFWDAIRSTMAAVPGADFLFEWDSGDAGTSPESPAAMYPGNRAVDIVATDAFDFVADDPATAGHWSTVLAERYGPAWMASFAAAHHKPMAIAMWGEVPAAQGGAGDSARYVSQMLHWAAEQHVAMCMLWDYQAMALTGGSFPLADAALHRALFAAHRVARDTVHGRTVSSEPRPRAVGRAANSRETMHPYPFAGRRSG